MSEYGDYLAKVGSGEISRRDFMRDVHRANAHNEHPIGDRLKDKGLFDHECVLSYYKAKGEPPPAPKMKVGRLVRRTIFQLEEIGEIFEPKATNFQDRAPWLYRLLHRGLVETAEQYVEYEPGARMKLTDTELNVLGPQPLGTAPHYDSDIKPTPRWIELFDNWRR
ncbi:hypothetical protein PMI42_00144 [Bradyrhizobium sp. YR681]|uniref:hypothetical protein n=1 Tax=Bradyrhizobium sp. YR681 TaxID=1144344 RepID=UPI000270F565|nr:hypothetical protein [Bradyrhizobium sp. YR681]EJN16309.1 hypothetical protein PMI42_00144 [Bradyrhizobium sp. YR681]